MRFRYWIIAAIVLFSVGIALGLMVKADFITQNVAAIKELGATLKPFRISTAVFIYLKNVSTLLLSFVFAPVFLLLPIFALAVNGWILSFVVVLAAQQKSLGFALAAILPHGILEIPAIIIGEAAALSFGVAMLATLFARGRGQLLPNLRRSLKYLVIAAILLIPAAFIETFITPLLVR
ncbi:MAG: stage II sporulation protein M [Dehalococcoidales bacterium]|nr:stage II sporulation protein M [Dehalococcoidales bacterium]